MFAAVEVAVVDAVEGLAVEFDTAAKYSDMLTDVLAGDSGKTKDTVPRSVSVERGWIWILPSKKYWRILEPGVIAKRKFLSPLGLA